MGVQVANKKEEMDIRKAINSLSVIDKYNYNHYFTDRETEP